MSNEKRGFRFVEVLIFCFITVILGTLVVSMLSNSREFSRTVGCINNMKNITQAIEQFQGDFRETPASLSDLYPKYITNNNIFKCPSDREEANSYERIYVGRPNTEADAHKMFLACNRHHKGNKSVVAYLSYAVDINRNHKVTWAGMPIEYGQLCNPGVMAFADGTRVDIKSGTAAPLASFTGNRDNIYSIIYVPDKTNTTLEISHSGDSMFEIVTPAVIAGVEGTEFKVTTMWLENSEGSPVSTTKVDVTGGAVVVQDGTNPAEVRIDNTIVQPPFNALGWRDDELPPGLQEEDQNHPGRRNFVSRRPKKLGFSWH